MRTILIPHDWTDQQIADYVAGYFAPMGIPPDVKFERHREPANAHVWDWIVARRPWTIMPIMKKPVAGLRHDVN